MCIRVLLPSKWQRRSFVSSAKKVRSTGCCLPWGHHPEDARSAEYCCLHWGKLLALNTPRYWMTLVFLNNKLRKLSKPRACARPGSTAMPPPFCSLQPVRTRRARDRRAHSRQGVWQKKKRQAQGQKSVSDRKATALLLCGPR